MINKLNNLLPKNAFTRGVSVLVGGTLGAQVMTILAAPLLTRLYSPEDFGILAIFASLLALIGVVSSLRYELAVPLAEDSGEAANIVVLSLIIVIIITIITGLFVTFLHQSIVQQLGVPAIDDFLWLLPLGVLLGGAYNIFNYWSVRTKQFSTIAGTKLRQGLSTIFIQLAMFKLGSIALIFGHIIGQSVGTSSLAFPALKNSGFRQVNLNKIWNAALQYRRFPIFESWSGLINVASHQMIPLVFANFYTASTVGMYFLAYRLVMLPSNLVGAAISSVFFSNAAEAYRNNNLADLFIKTQNNLVHIALPPAAFILVCGPTIFQLIFGPEWETSGQMAQSLSIMAFFAFVVSPTSMIFSIINRQDVGLYMQSILFFLKGIALSAVVLGLDIINIVTLLSIFSGLAYFFFILAASKLLTVSVWTFTRAVFQSGFYTIFAILPLLLMFFLNEDIASITGFLSILFYATVVIIRYVFLFKSKIN